jgi:LPS-assembly protein
MAVLPTDPPLHHRICVAVLAAMIVLTGGFGVAYAQMEPAKSSKKKSSVLEYPATPPVAKRAKLPQQNGRDQMLVQARRIDYDYNNHRVSAVGQVQIYYSGSTLEADKVIYDENTKRLHAEGNAKLTDQDGNITYGDVMDLSDDYRNGFVDSLHLERTDRTSLAAARANRTGGNFTVFESAVYTACLPCRDNPKRPPLWQVKAARIIHDQNEKMVYFEDAHLEFFGTPIAYIPYFSAPDPSVKRKTGVLIPNTTTTSIYGGGLEIPYYFALAPNYDATLAPMITTRQGPLLQGEFRQRLIDGAYAIRAAGIYQLDRNAFDDHAPGDRTFRGSIESSGQFALNQNWVWGWDAIALTDRAFLEDYRPRLSAFTTNIDPTKIASPGASEAVSQIYLTGKGDRSYFDIRSIYYTGLSSLDNQKQIPIIHPVIDYDYIVKQPILGGELGFKTNFVSLTRDTADFDAITRAAMKIDPISGLSTCTQTANPALITSANCLLRGIPGNYDRLSAQANWRTSFTDSAGQVWTPFASLRADAAALSIPNQPGVSKYLPTGSSDLARGMPTVGLEYRYPFINVQSWGTQTIEPIAQLIVRPNETYVGSFPNEDAQSLIFDDSNLFKVNKFSGWDRVEGGGRANVGVQYTAQFNRGGNVNLLFGQSYQLYGLNSFALGGTTNTGLNSGLDTAQSDYVARASYQPNSLLTFTSRFRMAENDFTLQRTELETTATFGRWTTTVMYGNYAAQPLIGFLDRREGILGSARLKVNPNWVLLGGAGYDIHAKSITQTQIGVGYIDDCLILALNYITSYAYSGSVSVNHTYMMQVSLRTLGGTTNNGAPSTGGTGAFGNTR